MESSFGMTRDILHIGNECIDGTLNTRTMSPRNLNLNIGIQDGFILVHPEVKAVFVEQHLGHIAVDSYIMSLMTCHNATKCFLKLRMS